MKPISFSYTSDLKSYLGLCFRQLYKWWLLWVYYLCFFILLTSLIFNNDFIDFDTTGPLVFFAIVIIGTHLRILVKAKGRYKTTPMVGQEIFWMMDVNGIERKNESFFSQVGWNTIYKIKNDEKWVLIYANKASVTYFPKELISDEELREIKKAFFIAKKTQPPIKIN